jgi:hypothetical protein
MNKRAGFLMCTFVALMVSSTVQARIVSWNDDTGGNWSESSKWDPQVVPLLTDTVHITLPGSYSVVIDLESVEIASLILGETGSCAFWSRHQYLYASADPCSLKLHDNSEIRSCGGLVIYGCLQLADSGKTLSNYGGIEVDSPGSIQLGQNHFVNHAEGQVDFLGTTSVYGDSLFPVVNYGIMQGSSGDLLFACFYSDSVSGQFYWSSGQLSILDFRVIGYMNLGPGATVVLSGVPGYALRVTDGAWLDLDNATAITNDSGLVEIIGGGIRKTGADTTLISSNIVATTISVMNGALVIEPPDSAVISWVVDVWADGELRVSKGRFVEDEYLLYGTISGAGTLTLGDSCTVTLDFPFTGNLHIVGAPVYFDPTTTVSISALTIDAGSNLVSSATINTALLNMNGGSTNANIVVTGQYEWTGGDLSGMGGSDIVIEPGITLNISGPEPKTLDSLNLTINGEATLSGSGTFSLTGGAAMIVNSGGTLAIGDSITITSPGDTLFNHGQITIQSPLDTSTISMFVLNDPTMRTPGTVDILADTRTTMGGGGDNGGTISIGSGAELTMAGDWNNAGLITVAHDAYCLIQDSLTNTPTGTIVLSGGAVLGGAGTVMNGGHINRLSGGQRSQTCSVIAGDFRNLAGSGFLDVATDTLLFLNDAENAGDINIQAGAVICVLGTFNNLPEGVIHGSGAFSYIHFNLVIRSVGANIVLSWTPIPAAQAYNVYATTQLLDDLEQYTLIATVNDPSFIHINGASAEENFYRVIAKY